MTETIQVAIIGLLGSGIGAFSGILINSKVMDYRLSMLEKKVDKHNSIIERTYELEEEMKLNRNEIKNLHYRLNEIKEEK